MARPRSGGIDRGSSPRCSDPQRGSRAYRCIIYAENAVDRVIRIQELYAAGLSSTTIARILPCMRDADGGPSEIATTQLITDLTGERDRIDRTILELTNTRAVLDEVIDSALERRP